jgi:hypothetical protein
MIIYNLAGVPASTANMFVRAELAEAHVPAFHVQRKRDLEVKASIVGFMHFANGLMVSFNRAWTYWVVKLSRPVAQSDANVLNADWREDIRVDGFAGGTDPGAGGVTTYHIETVGGLGALVRFLVGLNGPVNSALPIGDLDSGRMRAFTSFEAETMNNHPGMHACPAPATPHQLAELSIDALLLLGGHSDRIVANHKTAIAIATAAFGATSDRVRRVREELATVLRSQIVLKSRYYSGPAASASSRSVSDSYCQGVDLFDSMKLRMDLLDQIGRGNEARSVQTGLLKVALSVASDIRRYLSRELKDLNDLNEARGDTKVSDSANASMRDLLCYHCAYAHWKLAEIERMLGRRDEAELSSAVSDSFAARLSPIEAKHFAKVKAAA